jgi:thymidylate synthase (FAD)
MKIVKPSASVIHSTPNPERVIERMGRICYQSNHKVLPCGGCAGSGQEDNGPGRFQTCSRCQGTGTDIASAIAFVKMILKRGHESVIEHASAGFMVVTDRGVTHEAVRHRLLSFSQESTRFCGYMKEAFGSMISVIEPPLAFPSNRPEWVTAMEDAERHYMNLINGGEKPEIARGVLPNNLKSQIGLSGNFREWRLVLKQRASAKAHPQMREIAEMLRTELLKISKVCFEDIA